MVCLMVVIFLLVCVMKVKNRASCKGSVDEGSACLLYEDYVVAQCHSIAYTHCPEHKARALDIKL